MTSSPAFVSIWRGGYFDGGMRNSILPGDRVIVADQPAQVIAVYYRGFGRPDLVRISRPGQGVTDVPATDVRPATR